MILTSVLTVKSNLSDAAQIAPLAPLLFEINNLKRIRAANLENTVAQKYFAQAWTAIIEGASIKNVALKVTADAIIGANLGAIEAEVLRQAELSESQIEKILTRAFDLAAAPVDENLERELRLKITEKLNFDPLQVPFFVKNLERQPRSGATKAGASKLIFDAPENHAEHCITVAIYGVLFAPIFGAKRETVFLAALAHHFHNAFLPDSGFAGEMSLGEFLPEIFDAFRRRCLMEIPPDLHDQIWHCLRTIESADTPEAKAFHAADVIDRVLQMRHHAETNDFTLRFALEEAELVHAGAIQEFHYEVLRRAKLI